MTDFAPPVGSPPALQFGDPKVLQTDPRYQRAIDNRQSIQLIRTIAEKFDWRIFGPLLVAQRPEGLFVIDGQHRKEAAILRGDIAFVPILVQSFGSPAEEARAFVAANRQRKGITRLDAFHAAIAAGDREATTIARLVERAGLRIADNVRAAQEGVGEIGFTVALFKALRRHGEDTVGYALSALATAFYGQPLSNGAALFDAVVLLQVEGQSPDAIRRALHARSPQAWGEIPELAGVRGGTLRIYALRDAIRRETVVPVAAPAASPITRAPGSKLDLNRVASSMEMRAASWGKGQ